MSNLETALNCCVDLYASVYVWSELYLMYGTRLFSPPRLIFSFAWFKIYYSFLPTKPFFQPQMLCHKERLMYAVTMYYKGVSRN